MPAAVDLPVLNNIPAPVREKILKGLSQLPPFSPVLNKLLASLAKDDVPYSQLASIIEKDTVMSGNVLRLVNSAAYARRGEINSIPHAIAVLGLNKLRNTVLGLSISRMWASVRMPASWSHQRFNLHSIATAVLADHIAQHAEANYPEGAFVSGLLHDFGKLLIAVAYPDEYGRAGELAVASGRPLSECEREILGASHAECAAIALIEWNLPQPILSAVVYHHDPAANPAINAEKEGAKWHLSEVVAAANAAVNRLGHTVIPPPADAAPAEDPFGPLASFSLGDGLAQIQADFDREFTAVRSFF